MSEREVGLGDHSGIGDLLLVARVAAANSRDAAAFGAFFFLASVWRPRSPVQIPP